MNRIAISFNEFRHHAADNRRGVLSFAFVLALSVTIGTALPWFIFFSGETSDGLDGIFAMFAITPPEKTVLFFPVAMVAVAMACLIFEAIGLGYRNSTLYQVVSGNNASVRNDIFYLFLRVSGIASVVTFIMTLGSSLHMTAMVDAGLRHDLLIGMNPVIQFVALALGITFMNYWTHRLLHSPWFFEIHKVHHSAEHFGVLLPFRAHPLDHFLANVYTAGVLSVFGIAPEVLITWMAINAFYQSMVHSKIDWPAWMEHIVVSPALHRIHHSTEPRHFNKNMSILTIWDKLFGTYHPPEDVPSYGLDGRDRENYNTGNYVAEVFLCFARWLRLAR